MIPNDYRSYVKCKLSNDKPVAKVIRKALSSNESVGEWLKRNMDWLTDNDMLSLMHYRKLEVYVVLLDNIKLYGFDERHTRILSNLKQKGVTVTLTA